MNEGRFFANPEALSCLTRQRQQRQRQLFLWRALKQGTLAAAAAAARQHWCCHFRGAKNLAKQNFCAKLNCPQKNQTDFLRVICVGFAYEQDLQSWAYSQGYRNWVITRKARKMAKLFCSTCKIVCPISTKSFQFSGLQSQFMDGWIGFLLLVLVNQFKIREISTTTAVLKFLEFGQHNRCLGWENGNAAESIFSWI